MAIDYPTLVAGKTTEGSIRNSAGNDRVPATIILTEAETFIYRRLRVREMLTSATGSIADGETSLATPTNFIAPWDFRITGLHQAEIKLRTANVVRSHWAYDGQGNRITGKPMYYYLDGSSLVFDRKTDKAYPYDFLHYAQPAALDGSNTTNFLTTRNPRLLRLACMAFAFDWLENSQEYDRYLMLAEREIQQMNAEASEAMYRGLDETPRVI